MMRAVFRDIFSAFAYLFSAQMLYLESLRIGKSGFCKLIKVLSLTLVKVNGHFTVVCLDTKPLSGSEAKGDLVLIQTLLLLICKSFSCYDN